MPRALTTQYRAGDTNAHYVAVGPIPPGTLLRALVLRLMPSKAGVVTWGAVLTGTDDETVGNYTNSPAIIQRCNTRAAGHPAVGQAVALGSTNRVTLPIDRRIEGGSQFVLVYVIYDQSLNSIELLATVTWLDQAEEAAQFGDHRRVQVVTSGRPPGHLGAPGPAQLPRGVTPT